MTHRGLLARKAAYGHCHAVARAHYENFPVASLALPRRLRQPIAVIYAFARRADNLADEGHASPDERRAQLIAYGKGLDAALHGTPVRDPVLQASAHVIEGHRLPRSLFHDLLTAFRMDVDRRRYATIGEVLGYCRYSANPVGRLLLHLSHQAEPENLTRSDAVCTSLQLLNFLQDMAADYDRLDRIYLPQDEMAQFGVTETHFRERMGDPAMAELLRLQIRRARGLMHYGVPLGRRLRGRLGYEIRMIMAGGLRVLEHLEASIDDPFRRPRLGLADRFLIMARALSGPRCCGEGHPDVSVLAAATGPNDVAGRNQS